MRERRACARTREDARAERAEARAARVVGPLIERTAAAESLAAERSEIEVMLDHFSRRVVGGLVPVPTLEDVRRAQFIAERARQCLATGGQVALDERQ